MNKVEKVIKSIYSLEKQNKLTIGQYLPSENQLMLKFGFSRNTIRQALHFLVTIGKISSIKGKGYVLKNQDYSLHSFSEHYLPKHTETIFIREYFYNKEYNQILKTNNFVELIKVRYLDNKPAILTKQFVPFYVFKTFKNQTYQDSLFKAILKSNYKIVYAHKNIQVVKSLQLVKNFLPIAEKKCVLLTSITHGEKNIILEYSQNYYPLKNFSWSWKETFVE